MPITTSRVSSGRKFAHLFLMWRQIWLYAVLFLSLPVFAQPSPEQMAPAVDVNLPPVLAAIANQRGVIGEPFAFTATATDADAGQILTYSLIGAPQGASIDSATGAFRFTPTTPGSYTFTVQVRDDATPALADEQSVTLFVDFPTNEQIARLVAGDETNGYSFGSTIAMEGNTLVIGKYIFTLTDGNWTQTQILTVGDGTSFESGAVAIEGNTIVIGYFGKVYVFVRNNDTWLLNAELVGDNNEQSFGKNIALSGNTILVGAQTESFELPEEQGAVYVFTRTGNAWTRTQKLSNYLYFERFGASLALEGNTALIGTNAFYVTDGFSGAAYVYIRNGDTWVQQAMLQSNNETEIGNTVALSGNTAIVGGNILYSGTGNGRAYVYTRLDTAWTQTATLSVDNNFYGEVVSLALEGDTAIVGLDSYNQESEGAFVFVRNGNNWTQLAKLRPNEEAAGEDAGFDVALSGNLAVVGVARENVSDAPAYYVFNLSPLPPFAPPAPGNLKVVTDTQRSDSDTTVFTVSWIDNALTEQAFVLERVKGSFENGTYSKVDTLAANSNRFTVALARGAADTLYSFRIQSYNSIGSSPYSSVAQVTVRARNTAPVLAPIGSRTGLTGQLITFTVSATDENAGQQLSFRLIGAPQGASIDPTTGVFRFIPAYAGVYSFGVRVTDNASAPLSDYEQIQITVQESSLRIDCGSPQSVTVGGKSFSGDRYATGSSVPRTFPTGDITNTSEDLVYQSIRSGEQFTYYIPLPNGRYTVELNFAEVYFTRAGQRVFSVNIEGGATELSGFDVVAIAGGANRAVSRSFPVTLTDGNLSIAFTSQISKAMISAIQITPASAARVGAETLAEAGSEEVPTLSAYPNPFTDQLTLQAAGEPSDSAMVTVVDLLGRVVHQQMYQVQDGQLELGLAYLKAGVYLISVQPETGIGQTLRVVKQ